MVAPKSKRIVLITLLAFLAVTTIVGGYALLIGWIMLPLGWLEGSPFSTYTIPGLILTLIVGGSALVATILMLRRHALGLLASALAGMMIMCFEIVEVLVAGSQPGLMRNLQIFYFTVGAVISA